MKWTACKGRQGRNGLPLYEGVDWNGQAHKLPLPSCVSLFTREWIEIFRLVLAALSCSCVSLFTREWIEMQYPIKSHGGLGRLPLYEGVDWNIFVNICNFCVRNSLPLYEGVDWNSVTPQRFVRVICLPLYEGVDWNSYGLIITTSQSVSLFTREWIEIVIWTHKTWNSAVSLFTREWIEIEFESWFCHHRLRLPLYEGVDWNLSLHDNLLRVLCLPLYEGVDWNLCATHALKPVHSFTREWIEISEAARLK